MPQTRKTPEYIAAHIRRVLKDGGSAPHAVEVQHFFKEEITSRGWRTAELRKLAHRFRRQLLIERDMAFLLAVCGRLFRGPVNDEKTCAVLMLEQGPEKLGDAEFKLFESWLDRITNWADHDGLVHYLIGPMIAAGPSRVQRVFVWAKSKNRWHRRAAAVGLIQGTRKGMFFPEIKRITEILQNDPDDMVQKGLGWLLRETAKADAAKTVPYLVTMRERLPRFVLRTACETLPPEMKARVLGKAAAAGN